MHCTLCVCACVCVRACMLACVCVCMNAFLFVPPRTSYATLFINLEPVNDNPPMVDGGSQQFANVSEDRDDVVVHVLTAQDADTNADHSTLTWCITRGNEEEKFGLQK